MLRELLEEHLAVSERHVETGKACIERQRNLIAELVRDQHDVTLARQLLHNFEEIQKLHVADRNRMRAELACLIKQPSRKRLRASRVESHDD